MTNNMYEDINFIFSNITNMLSKYITYDVKIRTIIFLAAITIVFGINKVIENYKEEKNKEATEEIQ